MNFKRLVSGVCAFSIAVTQTAIVPISVSAVDYISVPDFTDQFKVGGCVNSTTGKNEWEHNAWDGPADPIAPSAKQFIINKTTMAQTETPDESKDVQFTFSTVIDEGYYQGGDEFDFTVYGLTITLTKNVGEYSEPVTEILSNAKDYSWTLKRNEGGWFEGNLTFVPEGITIDNFKDFVDNCSVKYEWSDIECTASRRAYFASVNAELWSGSSDLGDWNWDNRVVLPAFDKAERFSRIVIEYTVNDPNADDDPVICVADSAKGNIPNIYPGQFEDGYGIALPKDATSITLVLTKDAAETLKNGAMYIQGTGATLTAVRSLEADMSSIIFLTETNFPNDTFRGFIEDRCDVNGDKLLTPAELGKVEDINFSKPDENDTEADLTYSNEKYRQIDNFKGIEYLTNLRGFNIDGNTAVESIDLSKNTKIGFASLCRCEKLSDAKFAETLSGVNLCETLITEFDGSKYPNLESLFLNSNVLTNVDVSTNTKLENLHIWGTANGEGTVSDLSKNTELKELTLGNCIVGKLDLSKCKNLTKLSINDIDAAGVDLTGLSFEEYEVSNIYHNITVTDGTFDLDSLSDLGFDPAKATIADGQGVKRNKNILTVEDGVSEINYTYDTGLKGKSIDATFRVGSRTFGSVNATLWKGNKKFPINWSENILLPAFDKAAAGTRLTVEYTVTDPTAEELGSDTDWTPMISFVDNAIDDEHPTGRWATLKNLHPDQDDNDNIALDKDSASITVTLTAEAAKALNDGVMFINGCNITVTAVKSLEADPDAPKDVEINSTNFPNDTFREIVKTLDTNNDDVLTYIERSKLRYLNLSKPDENNSDADQTYADDKYRQIDNFKGIEYFTNLRNVNISGNTAVTSIDLSSCTKLTDFAGAECLNLEKAVLPEGVKEVYIYISGLKEFDAAKYPKLEVLKIFSTQVTSVDVSKNPNLRELDLAMDKLTSGIDVTNCPELTYLNVHRTGIGKLDVSKNAKLEELYIAENDGIELVGLDKLSSLLTLDANDCGLTKIDVSKNTNLTLLRIGNNSIAAIDLTGLDHLTYLSGAHQICYINLISNTFDLTQLSYCGFDISRMTLSEENKGVTLSGNVLTFDKNTEEVNYIYDTGIEDKPLYVKLKVKERLESNFTVSYVENDKTVTVAADKWEDVLKVMNNKNTDYVVYLNNDVTIKKLTFPTAAKAKSIAVYNPSGKTITTDASSVTLPIDTTLDNISIESTAKTFAITASKNLDISDFRSEKLKTLKGGAKSVLTFNKGAHNTVKADISGFGTIAFDKYTEAELLGTVKATTLKLNDSDTVIVKNNSVTFTNIEIAGEEAIMASICYGDDNFKPITVTGNITAENNASKIRIYKRVEKHIVSFSAEQTVLTAKTASFANVEVFEGSMPEGEINYTLARVGSDIKLLAEKLKVVTLYEEGMNETVYAQWSDVLSTIAANAKAGQKDNGYHVTLLDDYEMNGAFKMPAAKTYSSLILSSEQSVKTITFTGNITLTGFTIFNNIKLDAQKKVGKELKSTDFTIAAGKNSLQLEYVNANIKSITSSGEVKLTGVTVGAVTANSVMVWANNESEMLSYSAKGAAWDGKTAPTTTVNITGNLTVKTLLELKNNSSLSVGGIINAGEIFALADTVLVVKQQAKGKNALVIGKNGFDNKSGKINFVIVDPKTEKTAEITENLILGTIAGPYADQLVPSNDNLTEADSYYIIKDGKNLIAKPKATEGLVTVLVNGKKAYYKSLDDAIKDISATGSKDDTVTITLTQDMFSKPIAKLPLPSAGKYAMLILKADSDVTINITGDIALTGHLLVEDKISINKVKVTGKGDNMTTEVVPVSINVGKYILYLYGKCSADPETGANRIVNISGPGLFNIKNDTVITGKVNGTDVWGKGIDIMLDGKNAAFAGIIHGSALTLTYDKSISKNVKFKDISSSIIKLVIKDGENAIAVNENDIIAAITGDFVGSNVIVNDSELKIVRSGNNLKAVKEENVVSVGAYYSNGKLAATRIYDSVASAMNDISRIKNKDMNYKVPVKENDVLVLPKAKTYDSIYLESDTAAVITTAKDLTLTGNLSVGENITVNKADGKATSVNLNNYGLLIEENAHIAYDAENKVSRFVNISGKGIFMASENITVSGKVNVGKFSALKTTLGEKSSFSAALIEAYEGDELNYPVKIAKNVKFGGFYGETLTVNVSGLEKPNTQIASFTGSYIEYFIQIGDGDTYTVVPSGNKLMAVAKADAKTVKMTVSIDNKKITYMFDTYENAVKAIAKLGSADAEFIINVTDVQPANGKLTLPTKGKYKTLELSSSEDVVIKLKSDVALTGNLVVSGKVTLRKNNGGAKDILKFTTNAKDNFTVTVKDDANIINGKLVIGKNMTDIRNPDGQ